MGTAWDICLKYHDDASHCPVRLADFASFIISILMWAAYAAWPDLYIFLFCVGLYVASFVAWIIPYISYESTMVCYFFAMLLFTTLVYRVDFGFNYLMLMYLFLTLALYARLLFGFVNVGGMITGAAVGASAAVVQHAIMLRYVYPYAASICAWGPLRWCGVKNIVMRCREVYYMNYHQQSFEVLKDSINNSGTFTIVRDPLISSNSIQRTLEIKNVSPSMPSSVP